MPASTFSQQVSAQLQRLKTTPLRQIEAEVAAKRRQWPADHGVSTHICQKQADAGHQQRLAETAHASERVLPSPRAAFERLFFDYMGLRPEDLPILEEDATRIVWASANPCPTLEACRQLGLDTRKVCRAAYEKSTQSFVSALDPELRFLRDYREIRPYAPHCRERIVRLPFEPMMRIALDEARTSLAEGNKGYGAVAVLGERVLARAHDTGVVAGDPSLHAELTAIRAAAAELGDANLSGVVLFSTCEPCPMCAALAVWANVSAIVFGASIEETAAQGRTRIMLPVRELVARSPVMMEIYGGVLREECLKLYQ